MIGYLCYLKDYFNFCVKNGLIGSKKGFRKISWEVIVSNSLLQNDSGLEQGMEWRRSIEGVFKIYLSGRINRILQ